MKSNSNKSIVLVLILALIVIHASAQNPNTCCSKSSTVAFAMLSTDEAFKASHPAPLPFHYDSPKGKMIEINIKDEKIASAFEVKAEKSTTNYLFVIHEWWGLNDYIKQEAEKLQSTLMNVNVIALDLYDGKVASTPEDAQKFMGESKEDRIRAIINGAIEYAGKDAHIQTIGWCFGGGWSLQTSIMAGQQAVGCVMYYGFPEKNVATLKTLHAPVMGIFASNDAWINKQVVSDFVKDMKISNKEITVKTYEADHAFANPSNPKYDKESADDAHIRVVEFLKRHL